MTKKLSLVEVLRSGRQADPDGAEVRISRQAVEEAANLIEQWEVLSLVQIMTERDQLRGNLSLAEEGLANYAKEVKLLRDQRDSNLAKEVETVSRLNAEIERLRAIIQPCPACSAMDGFLGVGAGPPLPSDAELRADCAPEPGAALATKPPCKCGRTLPHRFVEGECGAMKSEEGAQ